MRKIAALLLMLAAPGLAATERTGDAIDGTPVIERLDTGDLASGKLHRFWFRVTDTSIGQGWYVPVIVIKGAKPGPRLLLTAGVRGDGLGGIAVIHELATRLEPATLSGTLVMIPGLNVPGLLNHTSAYTPDATSAFELNELMPGNESSTKLGDRYAGRLWERLIKPNVDTAIDLHTQSRGFVNLLYAFAETRRAREIAMLTAPDILKIDAGSDGTIENELNRIGVPSITLGFGGAQVFDSTMIGRAIDGIARVMAGLHMTSQAPRSAVKPFIVNSAVPVRPTRGGYVTRLVNLGDDVRKGAVVATIADPFGRIVETVRAPVSGRITTVASDPVGEAGRPVVRIAWWSDDPKCENGC